MKCNFTQNTRGVTTLVHMPDIIKLMIPLLLCFLMSIQAVGQTATNRVTGRVLDENGGGLPGTTVVIKGSSTGTVTDLDGSYTIQAAPGDVLVFSFVGYLTDEIQVGNQSQINVNLMPDMKSLKEVVVVGYGSMERQNVTGAISSIKAEEINKVPVPNVVESLRGQVPGVRIQRTSGQPGSGVDFTIRGVNSLTSSNEPLIVIDGVPMTGGNLTEINPQDIESINILKDAAAASIYGSSGANGVVLITTKRGAAGKPTVSVNASTGITELAMTPRMFNADEFVQLKKDAAVGAGQPSGINDVLTDGVERANYIAGEEIDWHDQMLRKGTVNNYGVSVSGGTEKLKIYLNGDAYLEKGTVQKSSYNRYSLRLNTDYTPFDFLKLGANVQLTRSYADETGQTLDHNDDADFNDFVGNTPLGRTHDEQGRLVPTVKGDQFQFNPLFRYANSDINRDVVRTFINPFLEVKILDGLTYRLNAFAEQRDERYNRFESVLMRSGTLTPGDQDRNFMRIQDQRSTSYLLDNILNYSTDLSARSRVDATLIYGFQSYDAYSLNTIAEGKEDILKYHGIAIPPSSDSRIGYSSDPWARNYYAARLQYGYDDRYVITGSMRADGSSKFGGNNKWGYFPSLSLAWNVDNESFLEASDLFSQLKFRASFGLIGNDQIDNFAYLPLTNNVSYGDNTGVRTGFTTGTRAPNANLRWEESNQLNTGVDFGLFNNRILGTVDYYITKTKDLLLEEQLPITSGREDVISNVGRTENWGIDANVSGRILTGDFSWEAAANASMNRNRIISLNRASVDAEGNPVHDYANGWFIDEQIGVIYDYVFDGIYQTGEEGIAAEMHPTDPNYGAGDPKIVDVNGDGVITTDDRTFVGGSNPTWYGGLRNTFGYKGFELTVLFEAVQGVEKVNYYYGSLTGRDNTIAVDYWTPENPTNAFPQPHASEGYRFSSAVNLRDASFISLRNISLNYTLPKKILDRTPVQNVSLYIRGNNLHYFTKYKDSYSPEVDAFNFPIQKVWTLGTRIVL